MKKLLNIISNRVLNFRFIFTTVVTALFAISLRIIYLTLLQLNLSLDQLDLTNLSFFFLVALFRSVLYIVLEELWPHYLHLDNSNNKHSTVFLMEDKNSKSSAASTGPSKTKPNAVELLNLSKEASNSLSKMFYILRDLEGLKSSKNINIFETKDGSLDIDVPRSMSDKEAQDISNEVSSLDAKYNENLDHYKKLLKDEKEYNDNLLSKSYSKLYKEVLAKRAEVYKSK